MNVRASSALDAGRESVESFKVAVRLTTVVSANGKIVQSPTSKVQGLSGEFRVSCFRFRDG